MTDPAADRPRPTPYPAAPPVSFDKPGQPQDPPPGYRPPPGYAPPAYPPQYGYGMYGAQPWGPLKNNGLGLASMVLGIIAVPTSLFLIGIVPAILALIFGIIGRGKVRRNEADNGGQALAGLICGAVAVAIFLAVLALVLVTAGRSSGTNCDEFGHCTTTH